MGVLVLARFPLNADNDIILGPWLTKSSGTNPAAKPPTDALGKYKQQVYLAVGSHWYASVDQALPSLPPGKVHLKFTIHSDGSLTDVILLEGKDFKELVKISSDALESSAPFEPFNDALIKEIGDKYVDDFTFSNAEKKK
jgi:outer membrane biosynthesis protein TonB